MAMFSKRPKFLRRVIIDMVGHVVDNWQYYGSRKGWSLGEVVERVKGGALDRKEIWDDGLPMDFQFLYF
jgi:hypothetical protein